MSTIVPKVLAQGYMPMSGTSPTGGPEVARGPGTVYLVPASTTSYVKYFKIFNVSASFEKAEIFTYVLGVTRSLAVCGLSRSYSADIIDEGSLVLDAGSAILLQATNSSSVSYVITGAEEA